MSNKTIMSKKSNIYTNAILLDPDFYMKLETDYIPSSEYTNVVGKDDFQKSSIYYHVLNNGNTPIQGWKIHVSAIPSNARQVLTICSDLCREQRVNFKFMCDPTILVMSSSKNWPRNESGKFITIYPTTTEQFKSLIIKLYERLKDYKGPYILSDKRYKDDCQILFYRYGGFKLLVDSTGNPYIFDNEGNKYPDKRGVTYQKPRWVIDPFAEPSTNNVINSSNKSINKHRKKHNLLNQRYEVTRLIRHTNSGGIYFGEDYISHQSVVIKEARPYTSINSKNEDDAVVIRKREWKILSNLSEADILTVPKPIGFFKQWENYFLVESEINGEDLQYFAARNNPLAFSNIYGKTSIRTNQLRNYLGKIKIIFINLITEVMKIHDQNIYVGDISTFNVIIDDQLNVYFPDLEGAGFIDSPNVTDNFTPGFKYTDGFKSPQNRDYFGIGSIMVSLLLPVNYEYSIDQQVIKRFLRELKNDFNFPDDFLNSISSMIYKTEQINIDQIVNKIIEVNFDQVYIHEKADELKPVQSNVHQEIQKINSYLLEHINYDKINNIIPGDGGRKNSLNVSNGLAGLIHYLNDNKLSIDNKIMSVLLRNIDSVNDYGLYEGLSGIAWTLLEVGEFQEAIKLMKVVNENVNDLSDNFGVKSGLSGIGLTNLFFFKKTGDEVYLNNAITVKKKILASAEMNIKHIYWKNKEGIIPCGYADGATGIAYFLLLLSSATNDKFLLMIAKRAIDFELNNVVESDTTTSLRRNTTSNTVSPYMFTGTAGLISVLLRFYKITGINKYKVKAEQLIKDLYRKYLYTTGYGEGLCGLGMVLLDANQILGNDEYLNEAWRIYQGLQIFAIKRNNTVAYPGTLLLRISNDFETGSIGVAQFYQRLINDNKTHDFFLDEFF